MLVDSANFRGLIFTRLVDEHREILAMLDATLQTADDDRAARRVAFARLARTIRVHARAEEEIVFPVLDGSYELGHHVREDVADHRAIDARLRDITETALSTPTWRQDLEGLRTLLELNFADEENVVFARAHCVISSPDEQQLLIRYEQDREFIDAGR